MTKGSVRKNTSVKSCIHQLTAMDVVTKDYVQRDTESCVEMAHSVFTTNINHVSFLHGIYNEEEADTSLLNE